MKQIEIGSLVKAKPTAIDIRLPTGFGVVTRWANIKHRKSNILYVYWMNGATRKPRPINQVYLEVICK